MTSRCEKTPGCVRAPGHDDQCRDYVQPPVPRCRVCGKTAAELGPGGYLYSCDQGACGARECYQHLGEHMRRGEGSPSCRLIQLERLHGALIGLHAIGNWVGTPQPRGYMPAHTPIPVVVVLVATPGFDRVLVVQLRKKKLPKWRLPSGDAWFRESQPQPVAQDRLEYETGLLLYTDAFKALPEFVVEGEPERAPTRYLPLRAEVASEHAPRGKAVWITPDLLHLEGDDVARRVLAAAGWRPGKETP